MNIRDEKCIKKFSQKNLKERDHFGNLHRWEDNIIIAIKERRCEGVN
jgi:hypothetical protein